MKIIFTLLLILLGSCSSNDIDDGVYSKSTSIEFKMSDLVNKNWSEVRNEASDLALINNKSKSFFLLNSACRKYESSTLNTLTASIFSGINNLVYLEQNKTSYQEREAMLASAQGTIDGVTRFIKVLTTQKNNCIYDFALISISKEKLDIDTNDFNKFITLIKLN